MNWRSPFWRYTAFQVPGWLLAAGGGWWLHRTFDIPVWLAAGVLVAWVVKDYALYPFLGFAYEANTQRPIERLVGEPGTAVGPVSPEGYVRVRGELWRAILAPGARAIDTGSAVEITDVDGMRLVVRSAALSDTG